MKDRHIRIDDTLWKQLEKEAKAKCISVSAYIRMILSERKK